MATAAATNITTFCYTVKRGDNLWKIAKSHGTPPATYGHDFGNPDLIFPGESLRISISGTGAVSITPALPAQHTVGADVLADQCPAAPGR